MNIPRMPRRSGTAAAVLLAAGALIYLLSGAIGENLVYKLTPSELMAKGTTVYEEKVRLGGLVAPNSVERTGGGADVRFRLRDLDGTEVPVHSTKAPPQMFQEGIEVVVEGHLSRAGVFEASTVMVMHSNEYRTLENGEHAPTEDYKALMKAKE